jgi:hypothetical protein
MSAYEGRGGNWNRAGRRSGGSRPFLIGPAGDPVADSFAGRSRKVADVHAQSDRDCGREWECGCAYCRNARWLGYVPKAAGGDE